MSKGSQPVWGGIRPPSSSQEQPGAGAEAAPPTHSKSVARSGPGLPVRTAIRWQIRWQGAGRGLQRQVARGQRADSRRQL